MLSQGNRNMITHVRRKCLKASATLEAAIVIPLYVYSVLAVMYVIRLLNVYTDVDMAAYNTVRELSRYSYEYNEKNQLGLLNVKLYSAFMKNIGEGYGEKAYIKGGNAGFTLAASKVCGENSRITLEVEYDVKNPFDIFDLGVIHVSQAVTTEGWLGADYSGTWGDISENGDKADKDKSDKVYVTTWGTVYHTDKSCSVLNPTIEQILYSEIEHRRNESGAKYYMCEFCAKQADDAGVNGIYITEYGDRYHYDRNCQGLKRTITEIDIKDVGNMSACKKCGGNHG